MSYGVLVGDDIGGNALSLEGVFGRVADRLGLVANAAELWTEIRARYGEPHRAYHTLTHIAECLAHFDSARPHADDAELLEIALFAHDVIYDPRRDDNEARSADWIARALVDAGLPGERAKRARALVLSTTHASVPADPDAQLLCDVDLAILGAPQKRFDEYESQIRVEYAWVPDAIFRARRADLLGRFLARSFIYTTAHFRHALERDARSNLRRSLAVLEGARPSA